MPTASPTQLQSTALRPGHLPVPLGRPRVLCVANFKGGVGKTTTTVNLAAAFADQGARVVVLDLDPQANAAFVLTGAIDQVPSIVEALMDPAVSLAPTLVPAVTLPGVRVAPSNRRLVNVEVNLSHEVGREYAVRTVLAAVLPEADVVLIDTPPNLGVLTINGLTAATEVLVPVRPHMLSLQALDDMFRTIALVNRLPGRDAPLRVSGILVNQGVLLADGTPRGAEFRENLEALRRDPRYGPLLYATAIPDAQVIEQAFRRATSVVRWQPSHPTARAYHTLVEEIVQRGHDAR